jgi:asparagine synthase (glutamine-hydrolysing)
VCRFFGNIGTSKIDQSLFEQITLLSKSGGPDSTEYLETEEIQFGFNRLAILDTTSNGNQPFTTQNNRYTLMLNGEIYNYIELKSKYNLNIVKSGSDAEVVLYLIEKLSFPMALKELNGMFAISCWDSLERKLFIARDFAGIKPLFYSSTSHGMVFGSQFNQILKHPWCKNLEFSKIGLSEYLQFGYMLPPNTIFQNVHQLNVGEYLVYDLESKSNKTVNYNRFFEKSGEIPDDAVSAGLGDVIEKAVKRQMISDVPLGVFLSGGIDSTLVAAKAVKYNHSISAITIGFEDPKYDESSKAKDYAKYLGIRNHNIVKFSNQQLFDIYEDHFKQMPEPIADYSSLPTYLVSKIARETNTVMLSGDGGDELFWGYPRFLTFTNSVAYFNLPGSWTRKLTKKALKIAGYNITGFLGEENLGAANKVFQSYLEPQSIKNLTNSYALFNETLKGYEFNSSSKRESLDYLRRNEFYFHLQKVLVKVDRMSMANSLEVRVPLLDKEVINAAEQFYSTLGTNHKNLKNLLKEELYKHIPRQIVNNTKSGFMPPIYEWSRNQLKGDISDTIFNHNQILNDEHLQIMVSNYFEEKGGSLESIWCVYVLIKFLKGLKE